MSEHTFKKSYSQFVNVLIFIFPIVINSVKVAGDIVLFILAVMGIFIAISKRLSPFSIKDTKVFSYLTCGYFLAVCLSVLFSGKALELVHFIPRDFHFLFAPFIALALYKAEINVNFLLAGIKVGLIVLVIISVSDLASESTRPAGVMNPTVFANLAVSMFFVALVFLQQESFKHKMFTLLSLVSGNIAILLSGSRSSWLSLLLLMVVYLFFLYKQNAKQDKSSKVFIALIIAVVLSIGSFNQYIKSTAVATAHHFAQDGSTIYLASRNITELNKEVSNWISDGQDRGSVGLRFVMYNKAFDNIEDVPFFGHGYRTSNLNLGKITPKSVENKVMEFNHLHNAYLTNYYNGGAVLLGALLLLLFVPLRIFLKAIRQNRDEPVLMAGVLLTVGFASHGMFNVLMGDVFMNAFYVFFLAIFLHLTAKSTKIS